MLKNKFFQINLFSITDITDFFSIIAITNHTPMKQTITFLVAIMFSIAGILQVNAQRIDKEGNIHFSSGQFNNSKDLIQGSGMFIPDGPSCPPGCFSDSVIVTGFPPSAVISSSSDVKEIDILIEHSFAGDLSFEIKCPNGHTVLLDGNDHSGGAYLGMAYDNDGTPICDPAANIPGSPWVYGWSNSYPQRGTLNNADAGTSPIPCTDIYNHSDYFTPDESFDSLIGCPLNGTWLLTICDNWAIDNGYTFGWEVVYDGFSNITGSVFNDQNMDGIRDTTEQGIAGKVITIDPGQYLRITNNDGNYEYLRDTGNYQLSYIPPQNWYLTTPGTINVDLNDISIPSANNDFGIAPSVFYYDPGVHMTCNSLQPQEQENLWITCMNFGTVATGGIVKLYYDPLLTMLSCNVAPDSNINNSLTWIVPSLLPLSAPINLTPRFYVSPLAQIGDSVIFYAQIVSYNNDTLLQNNYDTLVAHITGPYDPNYKAVDPRGIGSEGFVLYGQELVYTIHFQNTGNDTAHNVRITDIIDNDMYVPSIQFRGSSFPVSLDYNDLGELSCYFSKINLPDSGTNYAGSQGWVSFSLKPKAGLTDYTEATNLANIYFDFNPAIITNTVLNTYVKNIAASVDENQSGNMLSLSPNPAGAYVMIDLTKSVNDAILSLYDLSGKRVMDIKNLNGNSFRIDCSSLSTGTYLFQLTEAKTLVGSGKLMIEK
jgi:uncharacterized repeat protein (TIGR01451 family)